ncbi:MAG: WG repeat-containing protein [Clostridiales Family XIII bacterium]|nr:WG repeat-containing protein [Clostridiales Family XIII bacterium]
MKFCRQILTCGLTLLLIFGSSASACAYDMGKVGLYPKIAAGSGDDSYAIRTDGALWRLERDGNGECMPVKVLGDVKAVSAGYGYAMAIKEDGSLWAWGHNEMGQLGFAGGNADYNGDPIQTVPKKVTENVAAVSAGDGHTLAIKTDGSLWAWGWNDYGQLGFAGGNADYNGGPIQTVPKKVTDGVVAVCAGLGQSAAIKTDGSLWVWGLNTNGELGFEGGDAWHDSHGNLQIAPKMLMEKGVTAVSCEANSFMAIKEDGSLWAWGHNEMGRLGFEGGDGGGEHPAGSLQTSPRKIMDEVAAISTAHGTLAIKTDGSLWGWGWNRWGWLGFEGGDQENGTTDAYQSVPRKVMDGVAAVSSGSSPLAIKEDGSLWAWAYPSRKGDAVIERERRQVTPKQEAVDVMMPGRAAKAADPVSPAGFVYDDYVGGFKDGLAAVHRNGKWGYIDKTGNRAISVEEGYSVFPFSEGLAAVHKDERIGYIDKTGKLTIPLEYDYYYLPDFSEGLAIARNYDKYGYIDKTGKSVIPFEYDTFGDAGRPLPFSEGLAAVRKGDKWGYIDKAGNTAIPFEYDYAGGFSEGLAFVRKGDERSFIDKNGNTAISPISPEYSVADFSEGMAGVSKRGEDEQGDKWGFIDKNGDLAIPFEYESAEPFSEGLALVCKGGKYGFIDKTGNAAIPFEYESAESFSDGLAVVYKDGKYRYLDKTGNQAIPAEYDIAESFSEGFAMVKQDSSYGFVGKYAFIDKAGKVLGSETNDTNSLPASPLTAKPTASPVRVNGKAVAFDAYNINGNNYFKLRDLAYTLNGTKKQFEVGYDGVAKAITLTSGASYTAVGGEMSGKGAGDRAASPIASKIVFDGNEARPAAYTIEGNNYFKLRDLADLLAFRVEWDEANKTIVLETCPATR